MARGFVQPSIDDTAYHQNTYIILLSMQACDIVDITFGY